MGFIDSIDPFIMQLVIIPIVVIGIGVLSAVMTKRILVGPFVTLVLNLLYEIWYSTYYYPDSGLIISSWNIIFPIISLILSWIFTSVRKSKRHKSENK